MPILRFIFRPFIDLFAALEVQLREPRHALRTLIVACVALVATWFVYVPIHELLHVAGCVVPGGTVGELQIQAHYGGRILEKIFPFVTAGGEYAGRLTDFDCKGSDFIYFSTVFAPFLLTIFPGVALLLGATRRRCPVRFGAGVVLALAPLTQLFNDYYEMGSILVTRAAVASGAIGDAQASRLRSDDLFRLLGELSDQPLEQHAALIYSLVLASAAAAAVLALLTYHCGRLLSRSAPARQRRTAPDADPPTLS